MFKDAIIDRLLYEKGCYTHDTLKRVRVLILTFPKSGTYTLYNSFVQHGYKYNYSVMTAHSLIELIGGDDPSQQWIQGERITFGDVIRRIIGLSSYERIIIIGSYRSPITRIFSFAHWHKERPPHIEPPFPISYAWYVQHRQLIDSFPIISSLWMADLGIDLSRDDEFCPQTNMAIQDISHLCPSKRVLWMGTTIDHDLATFFSTLSRQFVFFRDIRMIRANEQTDAEYKCIVMTGSDSLFDDEAIRTVYKQEGPMLTYFHLHRYSSPIIASTTAPAAAS